MQLPATEAGNLGAAVETSWQRFANADPEKHVSQHNSRRTAPAENPCLATILG